MTGGLKIIEKIEKNNSSINYLIYMRNNIERNKLDFLFELENCGEQHVPKFQQLIAELNEILTNINHILCADCVHDYEEDYIDITPDHSQQITYCKTCGCTF
jgi:hypothetical protein